MFLGDTSARPSAFCTHSTLRIWLVVGSINVSICSVLQSIRSCKSLAARKETLPKLGYTYIAWRWVLCATWRKMKLIQCLSEREEEKCLPEIFLSQGSSYRIFSIFFPCVWDSPSLPTTTTIKQKQPLMSQEEGTEEWRRTVLNLFW